MTILRKIIILAILANLFIIKGLAQSKDLADLYTQKVQFQQAKEYKKSLEYGLKMIAQAEREFGKTGFYANYAFDLASLYMEMQDFASAEKLYQEALQIYQKENGNEHEYTASAWMSLGYANQMQNKTREAEKAYENSYQMYLNKLGKSHEYTKTARNLLTQTYQNNENYKKLIPLVESELPDLQPDTQDYAITLNNLGYFSDQIDDFVKAEKYYNESLSLLAKLKGKDNEDYAVTHHNLALSYKKQNKFAQAQKVFEQNAQLYEKIYGKNHPKYLRNLNNIALMQEEQKHFLEAEKLYQEVLKTYQKIAYLDSVEYAETSQNYAGLQRETGNLPNAIEWYQKAIRIYEKNQLQNSQSYISATNNLALTFSENAQYAEAEKMYQKNLQGLEKLRGKENFDYAAALNGLADLYEKTGKYPQAEPLFVNSLTIMEKITGKFHPDYATALNNLAYLYKLMNKNEVAEVKLKESMAILEQLKLKKSPQYAAALQNYGLLLQVMGKYPKAEINLKESLAINQAIYGEVHPDVGAILNDLGLLYNNKGQFTYAEQYLRKSLEVKDLTLGKNHPSYATSLINTGIFYFEKGEYGIAERMTREAMKIYAVKFGNEHPFYATALVNLGNIYRVYGDWNNAMRSFTEVAKIQAKALGENHPDWINTANFIGILFREIGDFKEAEEIFEKCRQIRERMFGQKHPEYAESLINLADTYSHIKRYDEAEKYYLSAVKICEEVYGKNSAFYPVYLNNLAVLYLKQKKADKALSILVEVKALREKLFSPKHPEYINVLSNLADTYRILQKNDQAEKLYLQVNDLILAYVREIFPYLSEKEQESFYRIFRYFYLTNFYSFAVQQAQTKPKLLASIYDNQLTTKLLLFSTATDIRQAVLKSNNPELLKNFEELTAKKEYLAKLYRLSDEELKRQEINLVEIEKSTNELEKKINSSFRITSPTYTWQDIQKKLKPNEAVIEMLEVDVSLTEDEKDSLVYVALLITPQTKNYPQMILFPNGNELTGKALKFYQNSIKFKKEDKLSYKKYWEPIAKTLPPSADKGLLFFSPDGVYNQINLNTLFNSETQKYLLEELDIQLIANSRDLLKPSKPLLENRELKAELFGFPNYEQRENTAKKGYQKNDREVKTITNDTTSRYANFREIVDLPGTKTEVETIEQILKTKKILTQSHLQAAATEEAIKSLRNLYLLHIATHGFFLNDEQIEEGGLDQKVTENLKFNPLLRSGLLLAGCKQNLSALEEADRAEDGILTAYEAANLNLGNTDLVVLSACETGLGEVRNGEGVYGLQRAFLTAGAKTLLMSLWTVSDEATQVLMTNFYRNWVQSGNKREAFKKAQIELKEKYPQPYFWGAFVMLGE